VLQARELSVDCQLGSGQLFAQQHAKPLKTKQAPPSSCVSVMPSVIRISAPLSLCEEC